MRKHLVIVLIIVLSSFLRLYALDKFPAGLNADEAAIGYNTYSLLQTGKDEYGTSWPFVFRSFDDYKPPLYFYLTLPFIKIFGLSVWAVRLPSAFAGILSVYFVYKLAQNLDQKKIPFFPEISSLILAISPWHLHFSRGGWEVNVSTLFLLLGFYFLTKTNGKAKNIYLFAFSFIASIYTYHSARIIAPLMFLTVLVLNFPALQIKTYLKHYLTASLVSFCLLFPVGIQMFSKEGQSRFSGVSIFADSGPLSFVHEMRRIDPNPNALITKLKYNRYSAYSAKFIQNYFSHFSPQFLFLSGDIIDRNRVPGFGQLYWIFAPFFFIGLVSQARSKVPISRQLIAWLLIAPIPSALTFQSPHALRSENMIVPMSVIIGYGVSVCFRHRLLTIISTLLLLFQIPQYFYSYYYTYPRELSTAWQYGFDQIASYVKANESKYDRIVITDRYDQPYILLAFYLQYPPKKLQQEIVLTPRDKFGFGTVKNFGKFEFRTIDYQKDLSPSTLVVASDEYLPDNTIIHTIEDQKGKTMYRFASTQSVNVP